MLGGMSRIIAIGTTFLTIAIAWSQETAPWRGMTEFFPSAAEIAHVMELAPSIPTNARFEFANFSTREVSAGERASETQRVNFYRFSWPSGEVLGDVQVLRQADCYETESLSLSCAELLELYVEWEGSAVGIDRRMAAPELMDVLQELDRLFPDGVRPMFIGLESAPQPAGHFEEVRLYRLLVRLQDHDYAIRVRKRCSDTTQCKWKAMSTRRIELYPPRSDG